MLAELHVMPVLLDLKEVFNCQQHGESIKFLRNLSIRLGTDAIS
jgi:hypothetical protein